jgi:MFS family permease
MSLNIKKPRRDRIPILSLLSAQGVSQIGNMMTITAGPWFVLQTTGSAAKTGLVSAALVLGSVLPAVIGGPVVDRIGFKRASVTADLTSAVIVASIPTLHLLGILTFWQLLVLVFLLSSINTQGDTGRYGLVPGLARTAGMTRERANAADRSVVRIGALVGPVLGGVLIGVLGAANVLFIDALTFCTSAVLVALGVPRTAGQQARAGRDVEHRYISEVAVGVPSGPGSGGDAARVARKGSYLAGLTEGLRFIRATPVILSVVLVATVGNSLDKPLMYVVAPVYARDIYGSPESLGLMVGAFGGGALVGTLLYGVLAKHLPRRLTFLTCFVLAPAIGFGAFAATPPLVTVVIAAAVAGVIAGPINPIFETVVQEKTPPEMLGRVFGTLTALAYLGMPIGSVVVGVCVQKFGLVPTIVVMGLIYVAVTLSMFANRALKQMDSIEPIQPGRPR